jgi:hypothetical protein
MISMGRLIAAVRRVVLDSDLDQRRYSDQDIREAVRLSLGELRLFRPDLFVGNPVSMPDTDTADVLPFDATFESALVYLTAGQLLFAGQDGQALQAGAAFQERGRIMLQGV